MKREEEVLNMMWWKEGWMISSDEIYYKLLSYLCRSKGCESLSREESRGVWI